MGLFVATNAAIQNKQVALQDFLTRFSKARDWAAAHPNGFATAFAKDTGVPLDVAQSYAANNGYAVVPIDNERIASVQKTGRFICRREFASTIISRRFWIQQNLSEQFLIR